MSSYLVKHSSVWLIWCFGRSVKKYKSALNCIILFLDSASVFSPAFFYPWKLVLTLYIVTESLNEFLVGKCIKISEELKNKRILFFIASLWFELMISTSLDATPQPLSLWTEREKRRPEIRQLFAGYILFYKPLGSITSPCQRSSTKRGSEIEPSQSFFSLWAVTCRSGFHIWKFLETFGLINEGKNSNTPFYVPNTTPVPRGMG